ncbi:MAG: hypothetical protein HY300_12815, partial [Verrucomicrobia bacterium]|nr:hypothetical protein [Verrucomicrobiota bacterium]
ADQPDGTNASFKTDFVLFADRVTTEWAEATAVKVSLSLAFAPTNAPAWDANWQASFGEAKSRWGEGRAMSLAGSTHPRDASNGELDSTVKLNVEPLKTDWGKAAYVMLTGGFSCSLTNRSAFHGNWKLALAEPQTRWGRAGSAGFECRLESSPADFARRADPSWAAWAKLEPFQLDWRGSVSDFTSTNFSADVFSCEGQWRAPELTFTNLHAELYRGSLDARGRLDVATRRLEAGGRFDFDVQQVAPRLPRDAREFFEQFTWVEPPKASFAGSMILPAWTNAAPDRWSEALSSLVISGLAACGAGTYRGVPGTSGSADIAFSNLTWRVTHLHAARPEGAVDLNYTANERTHEFHWSGRARIDPRAVAPLLENEAQRRAVEEFTFTEPPVIEGEISGNWREPGTTRLNARVTMTNFTFRGESCSALNTSVKFADRKFHFADIEIRRGEEAITAPVADIDLDTRRISFTNVFSTMDPLVATKVIGADAHAAIEPFHFAAPPTVRAWGAVPLDNSTETDLHFETIEGGPFEWLKFRVPRISGGAHWVTNQLLLTNVQADFYGGKIGGAASFDFRREEGAGFQFRASVAEANLQTLMRDWSSSNKLEGIFTGELTVTAANTRDRQSWFGSGEIKLRDGLLWEIPLFGFFSPVLNGFSPGLGNSRAKEGSATFTITNSVLRTGDLEIRSPPLRLHYDGAVDLAGGVNARVEAEMFRDTPLFGPLVSLVTKPLTKLFVYKITGTLNHPKGEPVFIPKLLLMPFHPIRTLKGWFTGPDEPPKPPEKKQ